MSTAKPAPSLRRHLLRLAMLMLLPALLLGGWLTMELAARLKSDTEALLASGARSRALAVERELEAAVLLLQALATSPYLDSGSGGLVAFHAQAREVVAPLGSFTIFVRRDDPLRQLVNSRLPLGSTLPTMLEDGASARAMRTGQPAFREPIVLPRIEQNLASVAVPVRRDGQVVGALTMPILPSRLAALLRQPVEQIGSVGFIIAPPNGLVASLVFADGASDPWTIPPGFMERLGSATRGLIRAPGPTGEPLLMAFERVPINGWIVILAATKAEEQAAWLQPAINAGALALGVVLLLALLTIAFIQRLIRPLSGLVSEARGAPRSGLRVAEFEALAAAVAEARRVPMEEAEASRELVAQTIALAREVEDDRQLLRSVMESVPDEIFVKDARLRYVLVNREVARVMGRPESHILNRTDDELLDPEMAARLAEIDREVMRNGVIHEYESSLTMPGHPGESRIYFVVKAPWRDSTGQVVGLVGVARDVTRRRATEQRLRQAEEAMRRIARADTLSAMSMGVAHELNQPLTAAGNFLRAGMRMLQGEQPDQRRLAAAREAMREASNQALRAGEILRRLRDFIGRGETEQQLVSLGPLVADGAALVRAAHGANAPQIGLDLSVSGCVVMADQVQLQQVFVNLLRNAIEATEGLAERGIAVGLQREGGRAVLSFRDAGPGLPAEVRERLFQPFVSTKETGMGIGLSICRAIIEAHGGRISAPTGEGPGTVIRIELPLREAALAA
ncbi:PAS domain-containing protein [Roseococcus sp. SDR]|uniref:sensor histidine kinase n=1 Tax=Roseococcus sp. SDR TaxID=2835532 RepID=UPI001BD0F0FC|nr:ATP-binding protein [Roseococcus sp. SDR]MBS7792923.1 PAS domain-containing protein [Roseococcus sp. SDR]MBV1848237.1 PAS domain-containing protein [Roseococcus sp. SDR]